MSSVYDCACTAYLCLFILHVSIQTQALLVYVHACTVYLYSQALLTFLHVPEGGVAEAVGADGVALPLGAGRPEHQLKVIQRAAQLLVQLDGSILG